LIILFNGPPHSGKDMSADYFKKQGFKHLSFKYQLYKETCKYFNCNYEWFMERYDDRSLKEVPHVDLGHMSCREAMIYVSEEVIKPKHGLDYFGKQVAAEIDVTKDYCISDGGFIDELVPVLKRVGSENFVLVQITREGHDFSSDSRRYFNSKKLVKEYVLGSKTAVDKQYVLDYNFNVNLYRVHNNSTIEAFEETLQDILINTHMELT
jgi:hypothetical protein